LEALVSDLLERLEAAARAQDVILDKGTAALLREARDELLRCRDIAERDGADYSAMVLRAHTAERALAGERSATEAAVRLVERREAELAEAREALEWYASEERYHLGFGDRPSEAEMDEGRRARAALGSAEAPDA